MRERRSLSFCRPVDPRR